MATALRSPAGAPALAPARPSRRQTCNLGMALGLTSIGMLFVAMTSAYLVREGFDPGWRAIRMPALLPFNTAVLLAGSITIEKARRTLAARWLLLTFGLGLAFVVGQVAVWRQLAGAGIYLGSNPHAGFVYLLTALHGIHITGGIAALGWLILQTWRDVRPCLRERWLGVTALYWHFMDGLWVYLFVLLFWSR